MATDCLNEPALPKIAQDTYLFDEISIPLLSVKKMCAGDLAVLFYGREATVFKPAKNTIHIDGTPVLLGSLDKKTELYTVNVHGGPLHILRGGNTVHDINNTANKTNELIHSNFHQANSLTMCTIPALINYYHMTMGAPSITTWIKAINKGWFASFPGLTSA